ncbi:MAG: amidase [Thermoleophilia bacterium]
MALAQLAVDIRAGLLSPREAVEHALARIDEHDSRLNVVVASRAEQALAEADRAPAGPLRGIPVGIKDVLDVAGMATTGGSRPLGGNVAEVDAAAVARLRAAGAVVVAKLNTHELAYGPTTTSGFLGAARNPWDVGRICGGSSGGSGGAVAAGLVAGALGTDTAGSIRIPAGFCGVAGVRPTLGLVSTRGMLPLAWSFDTVGPMAETVEDCALLLDAISGHDPADPSSRRLGPTACAGALDAGVRGLRVGLVGELWEAGVDPRVAEACRAGAEGLQRLGARVERVSLPLVDRAATILAAIQFPEATGIHLELLRHHLADLGADVRRRLLAGLFAAPWTSLTGQRARRLVAAEARAALGRVDLLLQPTMPVVAPRWTGERLEIEGLDLPADAPPAVAENLFRLAVLRLTAPWSLAGLPVARVPCALVGGLPAGVSLVGRALDEPRLLAAAHALERELGPFRPPL